MKIACCLFKYFPYGGLSKDFLRIVRELQNRGHSVTAYVQKWEDSPAPNLNVVTLECTATTNHGRIYQFCRQFQSICEKYPPDIILGFNKMPGLDFYYAADICYAEKVRLEKKGLRGLLYRMTPRFRSLSFFEESVFGKNSLTHVLFLDSSQKEIYEKHYPGCSRRGNVIPPEIIPACNWSLYTEQDIRKVREYLCVPSDGFLLLQIGSDFKRKGLERSIRAIASLPISLREQVRFLIIGKDDPRRYERLAEKLDIRHLIHFAGGLPNACIEMASADLFLHPAVSENTGTVILESIASGICSIVTANCGFSHYVREAESGIVLPIPFSQEEFNDALEHLLTDSEYRAAFAKNAKVFSNGLNKVSMPESVAELIENKTISED